MQATIFCAPDLHKRDVDFTSIKGYTEAVELVQRDILEYLKSVENPMFISLGDWYDKGYRSTGKTIADTYWDREINRVTNGNAYICLGNHFFLERDSNPEMYLIQPSYLYQPKHAVPMEEPIFRTAPYIVVGKTQISFFHFNKDDKNYVRQLSPEAQYHIGIYHDDCCVPSDVRQLAGGYGTTSNVYLSNIYSNIDLAICGHIHVPVGVRVLEIESGRKVPLLIPGALSITQNKEEMKHTVVHCPVIKIQDDGNFDMDFVDISTHMDKLSFYKVNEKVIASEALSTMGTGEGTGLVTPKAYTLIDFLRTEGYSQADIDVIMQVQPGNTDVQTIIDLLKKECAE